MKRTAVIMAFALGSSCAFAQDLTSKKGEQILPEAEDWSIGVDATPFLEYAGNFFGKSSSNTAPGFNFLGSNQAIVGKYFVEAQKAYRGGLRIGFGSQTSRAIVDDRADDLANSTATTNPYPSTRPTTENSWKHSTTNIGLSAGMEMRRGKTRLQGYYGGEFGLSLSSSKDVFSYGNALSTSTTAPVDVSQSGDEFQGANNWVPSVAGIPSSALTSSGARITERKNGSVFAFGLRGFIGVEYFILPKISIGGEFGWGFGIASAGKSTTTYESIGSSIPSDPTKEQVGSTTIEGPKGGVFLIDTDNSNSFFGNSGAIRLNFHF
jgi:hypothetical protein